MLVLAGCGGDDGAASRDAGPDLFGNADPNQAGGRGDGGTWTGPGPDGGPRLDECGAEPFVADPVDVNVLLVIDKSRSMLDQPDGFDVDKWTSMKSSLANALDGPKDALSLGMLLYPVDGCEAPTDVAVDIAPGARTLPEISRVLDATEPNGGTPTAATLEAALDYFQNGAGAALMGENFVLLATDGGPNCNDALSCPATACTTNIDGNCPAAIDNCCDPDMAGPGARESCLDDTSTTAAIAALAAAGVPTFVVGIPGTEQYSASLDAFAEAGGRARANPPPSYYAVDTQGNEPGGLTDVLSAIARSLVTTCRLQLGSVPPAFNRLNVEVDGELIPQSGDDGWRLDETTDPPTIELLGNTCERVQTMGAESVEVLFGCPTILG
jgi:hypothetical protein